MTGLTLEPGQRIDAAWANRARAVNHEDRRRLLARADELRESSEGFGAALGCYKALRDELDERRLTWLLQRSRGADPELRDVVQRAADTPPGEDLWAYGQLRLAEYERVGGQVGDAIERLRVVLRRVAGLDDTAGGLIAANLAICLRQQERNVESFVVARRAVAALARAGQRHALLHTKYLLALLYASFQDWPRHDRAVAELEEELGSLPPEARNRLERIALRSRAGAALERGDFERALECLARLERVSPRHGPSFAAMRAYAFTRVGRHAEARAIVDELEKIDRPVAWLAVRIETAGTLCSIALDPPQRAWERVETFLGRLETVELDSPGGRAKMLVHLARAVAGKPGLAPLAERAYGLAAQLYLRRIGEIEAFTRALPPSAGLGPDSRRVLGELRARLVESHRELMEPIANLLDEARRRGDAVPADWYGEQGVLPVCAWCASVRHRDGTWTAVGALVPNDTRLRLTHGMCPECRDSAPPLRP